MEHSRIDVLVLYLVYDISYFLIVLELSIYIRVNFDKGIFGVISPFKSQTFCAGILTYYIWINLCLTYSFWITL